MTARLVGWLPNIGRFEKPLGALARVGATADNDLVLRVDGVSRTHSRIVKADDGYWLEDAPSRNGTWLNGERVSRVKLRHLDVITFGRFAELIFVDQADASAAKPVETIDEPLRARLEWLDGPARGTFVEIPHGDVIIGRADSCALVVDNGAISRAHARLTLTSESLTAEDLGSVNGTFVNGNVLTQPTALESGATVELAQAIRFRVVLEGTPSRAAGPVPGATPLGSQDMDWSTRLVWSARDLAAQSGGKIPVPRPAPSRPHEAPTPAPPPKKAPAVPEMAKQTGEATVPVETGQTKLEPLPLARPPTGIEAASHGETKLGAPALGAPPRLGPETEGGTSPSTQLQGREAVQVPSALRGPQDRTELPPATVLGFRDVGPTPRGVAGGPASTALRGARTDDETVLPVPPVPPPPSPDVSDAEPSMIESVRLTGDLGVFVLPRGTSTVGRSSEATIRIDSREMSRIHAVLTVTEHDVAVEDRGSVNGTSVNGTAISGSRSLVHGDRVSFADFEFRVEFQRAEGHS